MIVKITIVSIDEKVTKVTLKNVVRIEAQSDNRIFFFSNEKVIASFYFSQIVGDFKVIQ